MGSKISETLGAEGASVVVHFSRRSAEAQRVVENIRKAGGEAVAIKADAKNSEEIEFLAREAVRLFGSLHIVVHCAHGHHPPKEVIDMTWEDWDVHLEALKGFFFLCKAVLPLMRRHRYGRIVFISGGLSVRYFRGCSAYSTVKAGLNGFCKTLALEEGPHRITVNIVAPGKVIVRINDTASLESWDELGKVSSDSIPLRRFATPEDVAEAVRYFVSPGAENVTGQTLFVSGGEVMG